ncbi:hypothetical protein ACI68E_003482 [Malassezia pachydermatis]|uniref:Arylsulfotransferase n=1 Tax=Malassezia pachydermatis TaxID=77020 RepID=A0A0M8MPN0_9BASI|nr:hypothetical protein Malapachy_4240 [Malassezia pachydermatis]KOS14307.1 hypothetical protein Malapachy_4240 [Malassezia pachydermatis]
MLRWWRLCLNVVCFNVATKAAFVTQPNYHLPPISLTYSDKSLEPADGYIFLSPRVTDPRGLFIYDKYLSLVYYNDTANAIDATYFRPFMLGNELVLVHHQGDVSRGFSNGTAHIMSQDYTLKTVVSTSHMLDAHEFQLSPNGYATTTSYVDIPNYNIGAAGNANTNSGWLTDSCIQEVNVRNDSDIRFRFCPHEHIPLDASYYNAPATPATEAQSWDWFHANSANRDALGNFLFSGRHTHTLYYVDGKSHEILWALGGKSSSFSGDGNFFSWQHYVRFSNETGASAEELQKRMDGGKRWITVYDNASSGFEKNSDHSRGLVIELDFPSMTATIVKVYENPGGVTGLLSDTQGSIQLMQDEPDSWSDHVMMGLGQIPVWAEFTNDGKTVQLVWFGDRATVQGYQVVKLKWSGYPLTKPDVAVKDKKLYVSWNGATEVDHWVIESTTQDSMVKSKPKTDTIQKQDFEMSMDLDPKFSRFRAVAMSKNGCTLGKSDYVDMNGNNQGGGVAGKNYAKEDTSSICPKGQTLSDDGNSNSSDPFLFNGSRPLTAHPFLGMLLLVVMLTVMI